MKAPSFGVLALCVAMAVAVSSCTYNNEEDLYPTVTCDTTSMNYAKMQTVLTNGTCLSCHKTSVADASGGGYNLEKYADLKSYAESGQLLKSVQHSDPSNVSPMPKGGTKISDCEIQKISRWIANGYPQ